MASYFGENIRIQIFGQSHSAGIGVVIDGLPAGFAIDREALQQFMDRRAPGRSAAGRGGGGAGLCFLGCTG